MTILEKNTIPQTERTQQTILWCNRPRYSNFDICFTLMSKISFYSEGARKVVYKKKMMMMMMTKISCLLSVLLCMQESSWAFVTPTTHKGRSWAVGSFSSVCKMAGGDGSESEWAKALRESEGASPGSFEREMKMKGLMNKKGGAGDEKMNANQALIAWLEKKGDMYLKEESTWGEAPHPMAISTETIDELTNESSGRGLLARRNINDGDELLIIPMSLCFTKKSAQKTFGKDAIPDLMNEYLAIACQLIHENYVLGDKSFYKPYMDVLPKVDEVNPTFTWSDDDLNFLQGSPVIAATQSLQMKLRREFDDLLTKEGGLCDRYPDRFPREVRIFIHKICSKLDIFYFFSLMKILLPICFF